jgi:hypothetical protein
MVISLKKHPFSFEFFSQKEFLEKARFFKPFDDKASANFIKNQSNFYHVFSDETKKPLMLLAFQVNPTVDVWISWLRIYLVYDPTIEGRMLQDMFRLAILEEIIQDFCQKQSLILSKIGYVLGVTPKTSLTELIFTPLTHSPWNIHVNFADSMTKSHINSSYHLLWKNPQFNEQSGILPDIIQQMEGATRLFNQVMLQENILTGTPFEKEFQNILNVREFKVRNQMKITRRLRLYKILRKLIWAKLLLFQKSKWYPTIFGRCYHQNSTLLKSMGFKITICPSNSSTWVELRSKFKSQLILTLIECLLTEGSSFSSLIDTKGHLNTTCFEDKFVNDLVGDFAGVLECQIQGKSLFMGLAFGKKNNSHPLTMRNALLFPSLFRGYGLGQILAMFGMNFLEKNHFYEKFEVLATSRNIKTSKLVEKTGFFQYGHSANMMYDISGFNVPSLSYAVGFNRTYRMSSSLLKNLLQQETNATLMKRWRTSLEINEAISST